MYIIYIYLITYLHSNYILYIYYNQLIIISITGFCWMDHDKNPHLVIPGVLPVGLVIADCPGILALWAGSVCRMAFAAADPTLGLEMSKDPKIAEESWVSLKIWPKILLVDSSSDVCVLNLFLVWFTLSSHFKPTNRKYPQLVMEPKGARDWNPFKCSMAIS